MSIRAPSPVRRSAARISGARGLDPHAHEVAHRQRQQRLVLVQDAHLLPVRLPAAAVAAPPADRARIGLQRPGDELGERALAGAVRPGQDDHPGPGEATARMVHGRRGPAAVGEGRGLDLDGLDPRRGRAPRRLGGGRHERGVEVADELRDLGDARAPDHQLGEGAERGHRARDDRHVPHGHALPTQQHEQRGDDEHRGQQRCREAQQGLVPLRTEQQGADRAPHAHRLPLHPPPAAVLDDRVEGAGLSAQVEEVVLHALRGGRVLLRPAPDPDDPVHDQQRGEGGAAHEHGDERRDREQHAAHAEGGRPGDEHVQQRLEELTAAPVRALPADPQLVLHRGCGEVTGGGVDEDRELPLEQGSGDVGVQPLPERDLDGVDDRRQPQGEPQQHDGHDADPRLPGDVVHEQAEHPQLHGRHQDDHESQHRDQEAQPRMTPQRRAEHEPDPPTHAPPGRTPARLVGCVHGALQHVDGLLRARRRPYGVAAGSDPPNHPMFSRAASSRCPRRGVGASLSAGGGCRTGTA